MSFKLPDSSLLPSTPNSRSLRSHPSTTPLVPPPSHLRTASTTPAAPVPKSVFGSSIAGNNGYKRAQGSALRSFTLPESSPPQTFHDDADFEEDDTAAFALARQNEAFGRRSMMLSSVMSSARGMKRSRNGSIRQRPDGEMAGIARGIIEQKKVPGLSESDQLVLSTERLIGHLDSGAQNLDLQEPEEATADTVQQLSTLWHSSYPSNTKEGGIGPDTGESAAEASYIASFLLELYHPHLISTTKGGRIRATATTPVPQALLSWLNTYHNPFPDDFDEILLFQPTPAAHESFWDVVFSSVLRGKLDRAIRLLKSAGWEHAVTALDDGAAQTGYTGQQLQNTRDSIAKLVDLLLSCPAVRHANWDVKSQEWAEFRQRVRVAAHQLETFAEGDRDTAAQSVNIFAQSARGSHSLSSASRKAGSKIPWTIYENLNTLFAQLQGSADEIMQTSQDWLEASIFVTVWWDGNDSPEDLSKSALRSRAAQRPREVDVTPSLAYRRRLHDAYTYATSEPEDPVFIVDTLNVAQVGIACAMEESAEAVVGILRTQSLPIASAVADIAALNEWLPHGRPHSRGLLEQGFDQDDLLVLSHDSSSLQGDVDRDGLLSTYADHLATRQKLVSTVDGEERQGWELAAAVLGRISDRRQADQKITALFDRVEINDDAEAGKVLQLCSDLGLSEQARRLSERYADRLAETTQQYGAMLIFYARAHAATKLREVLVLLTSLSLAQSAAMPPRASMDQQLAALLSSDRSCLAELAAVDAQAASALAEQLSGYALLRRYYELRDGDLPQQDLHRLQPLERNRQAAKALLTIITSASDCIRGGLFDSTVESVVPVDGLLVLLGEVLPLCDQSKEVLTHAQVYTLLRVIEDLNACPTRIVASAEDFLKTCLQLNATPLLHKSKSDASSISGLGSSSYDLLTTSSMLLQQSDKRAAINRAWDWRVGLSALDNRDHGAESLLLLLRIALAHELGRMVVG